MSCIEVAAEELNVTTLTRSAGAMVPRSSVATFFASKNVVSLFCPVSRRTTRSLTTEVATIYLKVAHISNTLLSVKRPVFHKCVGHSHCNNERNQEEVTLKPQTLRNLFRRFVALIWSLLSIGHVYVIGIWEGLLLRTDTKRYVSQ